MAAPNTFQIPAETVSSWVLRLAPWRTNRQADEVARGMEDAARGGGAVTFTRHQLWTWAEALQGLASKLPLAGGDEARALATELRTMLAGGATPAPTPPARASPPVAAGLSWDAPQPTREPAPAREPTPVITYLRPNASPPSGTARLVAGADLAPTVRRLLQDARQEVLVLSPWRGGVDTMLADLLATPPSVALRVISRPPEPDDPAYHRAMADLRRREVDFVVSRMLHTRMIVVDAKTLLLGAASIPGPSTPYAREAAVLTSEAQVVADARLLFAAVQREARGS